MDLKDFRDDVHTIHYTAQVNQAYWQSLLRRDETWKAVKQIAQVLLGIAAMTTTVSVQTAPETGTAIVMVYITLALSALLIGIQVFRGEEVAATFFRQWTDIRKGAESIQIQLMGDLDPQKCLAHHLTSNQFQLQRNEPGPPNKRLLLKAQHEINRRLYGTTHPTGKSPPQTTLPESSENQQSFDTPITP